MEEHVFDYLPGYALGSLDEEDLLIVARHLPHCAACRAELNTLLATADQLAFAAPLRTPAPELRSKILSRVAQAPVPAPVPAVESAAGKTTTAAAVTAASGPSRPRGFLDVIRGLFGSSLGLAVGALALLLIVFMAASNFLLWQRVNDLQARVPPANMQLIRLAGTADAPQATGYLMVFNNETYGTLVVENAPSLTPEQQYQLWLIRDGKRTSGGVFSVGKDGYGVLEVWAEQPLESFPSFGITVEPAGGSPAPTGKKILGGDL